jgi:diguanylate cyclase (GGDEF)-like protein
MIDPSRIWSSPHVPTLPTVAVRLLALARDPESDVRDVIEAIKADPAVSAKILRAANSSYFGFTTKVTSIDRAVPLLGTAVVTPLVLSFSLVESSRTGGLLADRFMECWRQSAVQGAAAEALAGMRKEGPACEFFLAGLLADLGRLAMLRAIPQEYAAVLDEADGSERDLHLVEAETFGFDHATVGAKFLERWGLPETVLRSTLLQNAGLDELKVETTAEDFPLIRAVAVASAAGDYFCRTNKASALDRLRSLGSELCGLDGRGVDELLRRARDRFEQVGDLYNVGSEPLPEPADLLAEANEQLTRLTLSQQAAVAEARARQQAIERQKRELEKQNEQLQQQVRHDPLTKLYNRAYFADALDRELTRCGRCGDTIGVLFCDIDRFKHLNDAYGHPFGDEVLKRVAELLAGGLRRCDVLARYGGEEFVVLVSTPTETGLAKVAGRLRERVEAETFYRDGERIPVTVSVGGAFALPGRQTDGVAAQLIAEADAAMYDSKRGGRNRVHLRSLLDDRQQRLLRQVAARRFSRWLVAHGVVDTGVASGVLMSHPTPRRPLGAISRQLGLLAAADVDAVLAEQSLTGERFGEAAVRLGLLLEEILADLLAYQAEDPRRVAAALVSEGRVPSQVMEHLLGDHAAEGVLQMTGGLAAV